MKKIKQVCLLFALVLIHVSCKKDDNPLKNDSPVIVNIAPISGEPGTTVVITGRNFKEDIADSRIIFSETQAEIVTASTTQLTVKVPSGASSGKIKLVSSNITVTSDRDFTIVAPSSPLIASFAPAEGRAGANVIISGANFSSVSSENTVLIGDYAANVLSASSTELTISIPAGAISARLSVKVHGLSVTSTNFFIVLPTPTLDSFSPDKGLIGSSVSFYGTRFSTKPGGNVVKFNDIEALVTEATATKITAKVPAGAKTGKINLIVEGIDLWTPSDFRIIFPPVISSITPMQGSPGTSVTINGDHFNSLFASTAVAFSNTPATITSSSDTKLIVTVPSGAVTGKITVVANLLMKTSSDDFQILSPVISDFTPVKASVGASITINGSNFSTISASDNQVKVNGTSATVTAFTDKQLIVTIPASATTGKISVEVAGNKTVSVTDFEVN